jgi:hypothetical protein
MVKPYQEANKGLKLVEDQPTDYAKIIANLPNSNNADIIDNSHARFYVLDPFVKVLSM